MNRIEGQFFWKIYLVVIVFFSALSTKLCAQSVVVAADKMNAVYVGVDNPLSIMAKGYKCNELVVTCNNGVLETKEDCHYNLKPAKVGVFEIYVQAKVKGRLINIDSVKYRAKTIPDPIAYLGRERHYGGTSFNINEGLLLKVYNFDFDAKFQVKDFTIEVLRGEKVIFSEHQQGALYSSNAKAFFGTLKPGDKLIATKIRCIGPDNTVRNIADAVLVLR